MFNTGLIKFKNISDKYGSLIPIESKKDIPFEIKRIYYIKDVKEEAVRGFHSHRMLHQVLICISGNVKIRLKNGLEEKIVQLDNSDYGLYIGPMIWREMFEFSNNAVLLVLASEYYDESDYIRDYDIYLQEARKFF
ncbi:sugar 3,4-ketoisomerase [Clostridium tertium]|uniref:sugar 3,4-ketoisomerase n=1 Tax=Clostridium tertium TaxID=1559 RepID=UPI001AE46AF4|nr:FdtA/QdtA family cupin domain-containing protein [Clostridium tertium]MBP1868380.1 dTDP-4-dehydrorhamnose 3,5-epimerase-like enzyme [Clostridium tertium]